MRIAGQCDGVRCDMAMLVLPEVFERTWGRAGAAVLAPTRPPRVRERGPGLPASWPRSTGTSSGRCSSRASTTPTTSGSTTGCARGVAGRCASTSGAGLDYQDQLARFLENHDEPRAAATFPPGRHEAAAVVTFLSPGLRFLHQGQLEGRRVRISPHLVRAPDEPVDEALAAFYDRLLPRPAAAGRARRRRGGCSSAHPRGTATGPRTAFIAWAWENGDGARLVVAVNYAGGPGQCYVRLPFDDLAGRSIRFTDLLGRRGLRPERRRTAGPRPLPRRPAWQAHVFEVTAAG